MKKFTQFINEGAVNAPKDNPAVKSYNNVYESEAQPVNEFVSVVAGCMLLWAFTTFVTGGGKGAAGAAGAAAGGGLGTILALIVGKKIADKKKAKEEEKKKKEEEEKKKKEEEKKEKQAKLDRLFLAAKKQLENVKDKDSQEYKDAQQFVNCYTQAKIGDDGKPLTDPDEITKRLKKIAGPELFAKFEEKGNEALRNEQIENMMKGLAITANNYTDDEVAQELKNEQNDAATLAVKAAEAKIQETNEKYDKQIKEAQEKGDNSLVESLKAEKELKLKEAQEELKKAQASQARVQKERELDAQRDVLKERQNQLATAQTDLARLQQQKADAINAAGGDEKKISEIENNYKSLIDSANKNVEAKQKAVDDTTGKISSLETELGSLANPSGGGGTPTPTTQQLAQQGKDAGGDEETEVQKAQKEVDDAKQKLKDLEDEEDALAKKISDDTATDEERDRFGEINKEKDKLKADITSKEDALKKAQNKENEDNALKQDKLEFKDEDGNTYTKDGDRYKMKDKDGEEVEVKKEEFEQQYKDNRLDGDEEDEKNEGEDEEDKEVKDDDNTDTGSVETVNGKRIHKNPAKIWHKRKKKNGGVTKSYYNKDGDSISKEEFDEKMEKFRARQRKAQQDQSSLDDLTPFQKFILEKTKPQASKKSTNEGKLLSDFLKISLNK